MVQFIALLENHFRVTTLKEVLLGRVAPFYFLGPQGLFYPAWVIPLLRFKRATLAGSLSGAALPGDYTLGCVFPLLLFFSGARNSSHGGLGALQRDLVLWGRTHLPPGSWGHPGATVSTAGYFFIPAPPTKRKSPRGETFRGGGHLPQSAHFLAATLPPF